MVFKDVLKRRARKNSSVKLLKNMSPYDIILWFIVTEKTHDDIEKMNKYVFKVNKSANKNDVKAAIKYIYNVDPLKVNISIVKYKKRSQRWMVRKSYKKAIVKLDSKDKINVGV